jgi:hypothetical protein
MQQMLAAGVDQFWDLQTFLGPLFGWLKEWQFLVGSLLVVFAGAITVKAINRQIREHGVEVNERRRRRVRASLASMPEDLHAICAYARRSAEVGRAALLVLSANEEGRQSPSTKGRQSRLRCPTLPTYVPVNLKALIENLDGATAEQVAELVKCYYTQRARLAGALENFNQSSPSTITVSKTINFNPVFKDTLELYLRADGMLQFAEGKTENITDKFVSSEILNAMKMLNIENIISPEAREHCLRYLASPKPHNVSRILSRREGKKAL